MSEINVPLLRKAVEWAEAEAAKPKELCRWMQSLYICPSPADLETLTPEQLAQLGGRDCVTTASHGKDASCGTCFCVAGWIAFELEGNMSYQSTYDIARKALGLTGREASDLFDACNSIEQVREIAEEIAGEKL